MAKRGRKPIIIPDNLIQQYKEEKISVWEIAEQIGCCTSLIHKNFSNNNIPLTYKTRPNTKKITIDYDRREEMVEERKKGSSYREIGERHGGLSRERIRQILKPLDVKKGTYNLTQIIELANINPALASLKIREMGFQPTPIGSWRFTEEEKDDIIELLKPRCSECDKELPNRLMVTCSNKCHKIKREKQLLAGPNPQGTQSHIRRIAEILSNTKSGEEYITLKEFMRISGLSGIKVFWLYKLGIISTKSITTKTDAIGRIKKLYSKAHAEAILGIESTY